jgi:phosphoribosylformylglycinamidine synthase
MGTIRDRGFTFLWYGQPFSDAFPESGRQAGSADASPVDSGYSGAGFHTALTMAGRSAHLPFLHCLIFGLQKQNCMNFSIQVKVMPLKELLDPQGKAVMGGLQNLGIKTVQDVRIGKTIQLQVDAASPEEATRIAEEASKKLLANPVMEYFEISVL